MGRAKNATAAAGAARRASAPATLTPSSALPLMPGKQLAACVSDALAAVLGPEFAQTDPLIRPAKFAEFDYQANVCLSLAKRLGRDSRELAGEVADQLESAGAVAQAQVAGGGFLNIRLADAAFNDAANAALHDPHLAVALSDPPVSVVIDYSAPNVAKEMHVGHLRSTIIGDALYRTLAFKGEAVTRQNHLGDWGTQFGMLVQHMVETDERHPSDFQRLTQLYRDSKARFDTDPEFARRARERVVALQSGDEATGEIWRGLVAESLHHINEIYGRLDVTLTDSDVKGESFYNDKLKATVEQLRQAGVAQQSDGAAVIYSRRFRDKAGAPVPLMVQKSDGGFGYDATDLVALRHRVSELGAQRLVYVTDARQAQHFDMIFDAGQQAGWLTDEVSAEHVPFGMVLGEDGKPFKTRAGTTVPLSELLDEAETRARAIIDERSSHLPEAERVQLAHDVGIGALKYADLSAGRQRDYRFSFDRMLSFDGNTGPYLQYAHVRASSIARKAAEQGLGQAGKIAVTEPQERALARKALEFADAVDAVAATLEPHHMCAYLYELASAYSAFYESCPVLKAEDPAVRASRLALCELTAATLQQGLDLLGIRTVPAM